MALGDPLVICREILLSDPYVTALVGDRVFATPILPPGHAYPLVRLTHTGESGYTNVGFRQAATSGIQLDVWAHDLPTTTTLANACLDALCGVPAVAGAIYIRQTFGAREIDESAQPPLHRYRADLEVRVVRTEPATP